MHRTGAPLTAPCVKLRLVHRRRNRPRPTFGATRSVPMLVLRLIALAFLAIAAGTLVGQPPNDDCADATALCAQQPMAGDNTGALNSSPAYCQPGAMNVWYTFTTNSVGGEVTVELDGIDCPGITGMDNGMSLIMLAGDGSCTPASFAPVSACASDSILF